MKLEELLSTSYLTDTHCHLEDKQFSKELETYLANAIAANVKQIMCIGIDFRTSTRALEIAAKYSEIVKASAGLHPAVCIPGSDMTIENLDENAIPEMMLEIETIVKTGNIFMIGECGMDYYYLSDQYPISNEQRERSKRLQELLFESHLHLAEKYSLPLTIHARDCIDECFDLVNIHHVEAVFHSFTGNIEQAKKIIEAGHYIGVNGIITYPKAKELREVVKAILGNKKIKSIQDLYDAHIVLETDAPFLAPQGKRGQVNEPANVADIFSFLQSL